MPMQTVQIRLSPEQLTEIDRKVEAGIYQSRSEAIRDYIRKAEFFEGLAKFRKLAAETGLDEDAIWEDDESIRQDLYRQLTDEAA